MAPSTTDSGATAAQQITASEWTRQQIKNHHLNISMDDDAAVVVDKIAGESPEVASWLVFNMGIQNGEIITKKKLFNITVHQVSPNDDAIQEYLELLKKLSEDGEQENLEFPFASLKSNSIDNI